MPHEPPQAPGSRKPAPKGTPTPETAPAATTARGAGHSAAPPAVADLQALVEQAKARSRAAVEAKLAKQRAKDRKVANLTSDAGYKTQRSAAQRIEALWQEAMKAAFPDVPHMAWFKRERGGKTLARKEGKLVADLIEGYGNDEKLVTELVLGFITHWKELGPRLTKSHSSIPSIGLLYACRDTVMAEVIRHRPKPAPVTAVGDHTVPLDPFAVKRPS